MTSSRDLPFHWRHWCNLSFDMPPLPTLEALIDAHDRNPAILRRAGYGVLVAPPSRLAGPSRFKTDISLDLAGNTGSLKTVLLLWCQVRS